MVAAFSLVIIAAIEAQTAASRAARGVWVSPAATNGIAIKLGGAIALYFAARGAL